MRYPPIPKPKPELTRDIAEAVSLFQQSEQIQDVAEILEVHPGHLKCWLYSNPGHKGYRVFQIPKKSGGERTISEPPSPIKILQLKFKLILDQIYQPKSCVYGFVSNRSIVDGAIPHKKRAKWVLNIDLNDFFPSIHFGRIRGLFLSLGVGPNAAAIWAHLVTCDGVLPQGAPTSPVLSNMIARQLDTKLIGLANRFHLTYTRYADDLTFSTTQKNFPAELVEFQNTPLDSDNVKLLPRLTNVFQLTGFTINPQKTRLQSKAVRQEVTGLTVNEFVNVRRKHIRQIRAMIHAAKKFGFQDACREYIEKYAPPGRITAEVFASEEFDPELYFKLVIYGKLAFVRMVRGKTDKCYINLCLQMAEIDHDPPSQIVEIKQMHEEFDVFICHASEDKERVATPLFDALQRVEVTSFIDNEYITWGDSFVEKINHALSRARLIIVVISNNSINKAWPKKELNASLAREVEGRTKVLPLMIGTDTEIDSLLNQLPLLKDKHYEQWNESPDEIAQIIKAKLM